MGFLEAFRMAWESLRANKLRSGLTLLGMVIGIFAIITSVTAVKVIEVYFQESLNILGSSTFSVSRYPSIQFDGERGRNRRNITYDQVERLQEQITLPLTVSPEEYFARVAPRYGTRETEPNVAFVGSDENYPVNFGYEVAEGRSLSPQDVQYGRSVVLLGSAVAEELFDAENPLGKDVRIGGQRFQVVGVLASKGSFLGFSFDNRVVIPISAYFLAYGNKGQDLESVSIRADDVNEVPAATEHVIGLLRAIRKVPPGEPNDFEVETNDTVQGGFLAFTAALTVGGAAIGLISLIAAGVGIMNIMLVSVTERTREIGIRKSVGARRRDIMRQFLLEAIFLCQIGGLLGILLGAAAGNGVALFFDITAVFPLGWAIAGVVMVTVIAVVFGGYPALKAARMDPIESLRFE